MLPWWSSAPSSKPPGRSSCGPHPPIGRDACLALHHYATLTHLRPWLWRRPSLSPFHPSGVALLTSLSPPLSYAVPRSFARLLASLCSSATLDLLKTWQGVFLHPGPWPDTVPRLGLDTLSPNRVARPQCQSSSIPPWAVDFLGHVLEPTSSAPFECPLVHAPSTVIQVLVQWLASSCGTRPQVFYTGSALESDESRCWTAHLPAYSCTFALNTL